METEKELGPLGEDEAVRHLAEKGYSILHRNWRFGNDEIDIIANDGETLVIAEVKTRSSASFGEPATFVTKQKQKFLIRAAAAYIVKNNIETETRFDIVSIIMNDKQIKISHIENAFYPTLR